MNHFSRFSTLVFVSCLCLPITESQAGHPIPPFVVKFLNDNCTDCHNQSSPEADLNLDLTQIDWSDRGTIANWESVHTMVSKEIMPPPDASLPSQKKRDGFLSWLDQTLIKQSPIGGTSLRRLSRREYEKTIRKVFALPNFTLPNSFPPDNKLHGFNNQGEALVVAASHLEAFSETAALVADEFFKPPREPVQATTFDIAGKELVITYSSACFIDGAMRLGSSGSIIRRNATWPMRFAAPASGQYKVEITASFNGTPPEPPTLDVSSMDLDTRNHKKGTSLEIPPGKPNTFQFDLDLQRGRTVVFRYSNGPFDYGNKSTFPNFLKQLFLEDPRLAAAWTKIGQAPRGGSGWLRLKEAMDDPQLDVVQYSNDDRQLEELVKRLAGKAVNTGETLVYKYFEEGPNIGIHSVRVTGPLKIYPDSDDMRVERQRKKLLGQFEGKSDGVSLQLFFKPFLSTLFRRPASESEIAAYVNLVRRELKSERSDALNDRLHLAIRTALISPAFLYRSIGPGKLNDHELASRLAYFLTSGPPTAKLQKVVAAGRISRQEVLVKEARRLINDEFAEDFTTQWLGLEKLDNLMPDARLIPKFSEGHRLAMRDEVKQTFQHILENNLPVSEFIAPDFVFTDPLVGWEIYGFDQFRPPTKKQKRTASSFRNGMQQVEIPRDGRKGGLLSMPAIMMATANGVDTQPVLRGVWMLENILGSPPPDPPNAVPALTPDTAGAKSPRERLAAHMSSDKCALCHREIDPLGFVLENYDPIGRWRDHYPKYLEDEEGGKSKRINGLAVDATGTLPSGAKLTDVTDLKRILSENPEPFARCISEKLLTYATGRKLNYRERAIVAGIVNQQSVNELRFKDLLLALIDSDIFRTK